MFLGCAGIFAYEINSVKFEGLSYLSPQTALDISGLKVGDTLSESASNAAIINLYRQNYFEDISIIDDENGNVLIKLKEKPSIALVKTKGVVSNDEKAINSLIDIKAGSMYDESAVERTKERIRQFYEAKGYFDTVIDASTQKVSDKSNALILTLDINRGENLIIKKVNLIGAKEFSYDDIEPVIANKSKEFMGWLWGRNDGKAKLYELASDSERIKDFYLQRGYLDAEVSSPFLQAFFDEYRADLSYYIKEGKVYKISEVSLNAPDELGLNIKRLKKDLYSVAGDKINSAKIRKDVQKLQNLVADMGYAYANVRVGSVKNGDDKVAIEYDIIPGQKVRIRNLIISGNDRTADKVVRRELYLTEGNLYSQSDLRESLNALRRTGYFGSVDVDERRISENEMDLIVEVKEAQTGSISGGLGYGSSDGLIINANVSDGNIFGSGLKGSISIDRSNKELSGQISLTNPRLFDSFYSLGGSIYANRYEWKNYKEYSKGLSLNVGRSLGRYVMANLNYTLEKGNIKGLSEALLEVGYKEGSSIKSAFTPSISFNSTDDFYLPRSGVIFGTSLEIAGAGGDQKFLKSNSYFNLYFGLNELIDMDLILRYKARFAKIWDRGYTPINEKLYLGGISTLRGYESRSVSPKVMANANTKWYETGGEISFNNSFELSFPIIDRVKLRGLFFYDYGMIGERKLDEIKRSSFGGGIEWITPIGPLQIILAKAINPAKNDDVNRFEFNIGRRF